jgi:hypothetical protein
VYALIGATSTAPGRSRNLHTAWASGIPLGRRACPAEVSDEEYEACLADLHASRAPTLLSYGGVDTDVASTILNGPAPF